LDASIHAAPKLGTREYSGSNPPSLARHLIAPFRAHSLGLAIRRVEPKPEVGTLVVVVVDVLVEHSLDVTPAKNDHPTR
jgi:hypothetical protein